MAKPGDWGGDKQSLPRIVTREKHVTKNATVSRDEAKSAQGEAPPLKYYPSPQYQREPFNPQMKRRSAKANRPSTNAQ